MFDISEPIVQLLGIGLTVDGSASLTGESDLVSALIVVVPVSSGLSAESDLSANIDYIIVAGSNLSSDSALSADGITVALVDASLSAESDLVAGMQQQWSGEAALSAEATLLVTSNIVALAAALANGGSNLVANGVRLQTAVPRPMAVGVTGTFTCTVSHPVAARPFVASSALTATIYTNPRLLVLPTVEYAYTDNVLLRRYPIDNGQALVITDGIGELLDFPAQQIIAQADYYFPGGRRVELDPTQEAAVVAAGYGEYIETEFLS